MAWAHVQGQHIGDGSQGANWTLSKAGSTIGTGNLVVGVCLWGDTTTTDLSAVKVSTTSCTIVSRVVDTTNTEAGALFYLNNCPASQTTVTATGLAGGGALFLMWDEFSGNDASSAANGSASRVQGSPGTTADAIKTGSTVGASGNLIYGMALGDSASGTLSLGTGFSLATADHADAQDFGLDNLSEFKTASGASDATFTVGTNGSYFSFVLAFTPAAAGGNTISGNVSLPILTLSSSVKVTDKISGSLSLPLLTLSSSLKVSDKISGNLSLPLLTLSSSLKVTDKISGSVSLPLLTLSASVTTTGGTISGGLALPRLTLSSALAVTDKISGSVALPSLSISGQMTAPRSGGAIYEYQDYPWWLPRYDPEHGLKEARRALGILPKEAKKAVEKAARVIIDNPKRAKTEAAAFDFVKAYERQFRQALRDILSKARAEDIEQAWREEVARSLVERADEEVLLLVGTWLL